MDYYQLTRNFLTEFFGTSELFNVEYVANNAANSIDKRVHQYLNMLREENRSRNPEWIADLKKYLASPYDKAPEEYDEIFYQLDQDPVMELFTVTKITWDWLALRCKTECPNGDCFDGNELKMNYDFNVQLFKHALDLFNQSETSRGELSEST